MRKYLSILLMSILVFGVALTGVTAGAQGNNTTENQSVYQVSTINGSTPINESCLVNETETVGKIKGTPTTEQKFRIGPTVVLRPVNDVITENEDGLVELYIDNPSLNDVTLNVDARISVPSGIHVYGQGFGQTGSAGVVQGTFSVPPGNARTIYINIKGEKVGSSTVYFTGLYWLGDNKDDYSPISLSHPFTVKEPSKNPTETSDLKENSGVEAKGQGSFSTPGFGIIIAGMGLLGVYIVRRR
ncbi:MAG: PGF-CTERM sorting domain-containing protein [Dysgonamonadaceae bacterium]|jgi:hypothetical protein|nr:PGF-CTERM sorting domain-containing protein [Dysgonamonadaceae bacterium]